MSHFSLNLRTSKLILMFIVLSAGFLFPQTVYSQLDTASLAGFVYDSDGIPLAGQPVTLSSSPDDTTIASMLTGSEGEYLFDSLPAGEYMLRVDASHGYASEYFENFHNWKANHIYIPAGESFTELNFYLEPGGSIFGRLVTEDGITPVPGAWVEALSQQGYRTWGAYSDLSGEYVINGLMPGEVILSARAPGRAFTYYGGSYTRDEAIRIQVQAGVYSQADFLLQPGYTLDGVVTAEDHTPLEQVAVEVNGDNGFWAIDCTDGSGWYQIPNLPVTSYTARAFLDQDDVWCIEPEAYAYQEDKKDIEIVDSDRTLEPIKLQAAGIVTGTVFSDEYSKQGVVPVYGGGVVAYKMIEGDNCQVEQVFYINGEWPEKQYFLFNNLPPGTYKFRANPPDWVEGLPGMPTDWYGFHYQYYQGKYGICNADPLDIHTGNNDPIHFVVPDVAHVTGTVKDINGDPIQGEVGVGFEIDEEIAESSSCSKAATGTYKIGVPKGVGLKLVAGISGCESNRYALTYYETPDGEDLVFTVLDNPGYDFYLPFIHNWEHLTINLQDTVLADPAVRQAIAYGTDRQRILNQAFLPNGYYGMLLNSYMPPGHWGAAPADLLATYPYDPVLAREVLEQAGWVDSNNDGVREKGELELAFEFYTSYFAPRPVSASIFAENMAAIGARVDTFILSFSELNEQHLLTGDFGIAEFAWTLTNPQDDSAFPLDTWVTGNDANVGAYSNAVADQEVTLGRQATTREERLPHMLAHQQIISQDLPVLPLFTRYLAQSVPMPAGSQVVVLLEPGTTLTFQEVSAEGFAGQINEPANPEDIPDGFLLHGKQYQIGSSASYNAVQVCLEYDDAELAPLEEASLRLFQEGNLQWADITDDGYPDTLQNLICGSSTSLSRYVLLLPSHPTEITAWTVPQEPLPVNFSLQVSASFSDADIQDVHIATWDWGDGTTSNGLVTESGGSGTASGSHTYTISDVYTLTLTLTTLRDGSTTTADYQYIVIYDPQAGFITGGGWIDSPVGALNLDPSLSGKANFGFEARYKTSGLIGNLEFSFSTGDLNFHSTALSWLVMNGARAQLRGSGELKNQEEIYAFLLTVIDGDLLCQDCLDRFRLRVWNPANGQTIYDTQPGSPDSADPLLIPGGGSIKVHANPEE